MKLFEKIKSLLKRRKKERTPARKVVVTHYNVDLDAVIGTCVELIKRGLYASNVAFVSSATVQVEDWQVAVDIRARKHGNAASFVGAYCSDVLPKNLVKEVNIQDSGGEVPSLISLTMVIGALKAAGRSDRKIVRFFLPIVRGMMIIHEREKSADTLFRRSEKIVMGDYKFLLMDMSEKFNPFVKRIAMRNGICGAIYRSKSGWGITRYPGFKRPNLRKLSLDGWFTHPSGFLFCWGSRKAIKKEDPPQFESFECFIEWLRSMLSSD